MIELLSIYIVISYASDIEVYGVIVAVRLGLVSIVRQINGIGSVLLYMVIWPLMLTYMGWMRKIVPALKINEGVKKGLILGFLMVTIRVRWYILYILGVVVLSGILSVVRLRVYIYIILSVRVILILVLYIINMNFVNVNYKLILLRLLPLPVFFVKICGRLVVLYYIMLFSYVNFLL